GGCEKPPPANLASDVALAGATAEALDPGPSEANLVFQAPTPGTKPKPKPAAKPAEPAKPEPAKAEPPKPEPPKPEPPKPEPPKVEPPKTGTLPTGTPGTGTATGGVKPEPPRPPRIGSLPPGNFDATTATVFREIAVATGGGVFAAATAGALPGAIARLLNSYKEVPDLDMALLIDATGSMSDDLAALRGAASSMLAQAFNRPGKTRVAVVYYKDAGGECPWVTRIESPFTEEKGAVAGAFARANIGCGGDEPEHVYAGIYKAAAGLSWRPEAIKLLVVIGDAPPHEKYADYNRGNALGKAKAVGIAITTIIVGK
ncbi:MAG: VWA domain-containing protein, partial [Deltaproteobacteria bacterium]|nr:VWA domain-containing protein [Deltaproteobacteria bacterium]